MLKAIFDRTTTNPLREAVRNTFPAMRAVAGLSIFLNLLIFAPSLYMENSFDRVLASRNLVTWGFLTALLVVMIITQGILSDIRTRILARVGVAFDLDLSGKLFDAVHRAALVGSGGSGKLSPVQAVRDLDVLRENLSGKLVASAVDMLFLPVFLLACILIHPLVGLAVFLLMVAVASLGFLINLASASDTLRSTAAGIHAAEYASSMLRNAEAIHALGMRAVLQARWKRLRDAGLAWGALSLERNHVMHVALGALLFGGSTLILAVTLILVVNNMVSAGVLFGAMIISGKAISPISNLSRNWKSFVAAQYAFERVDRLFNSLPALPERMELPRPAGTITFDNVSAVAPGSNRLVLRNLSFELPAGQVLAVIGPSGAGKSSLARVLVGIWPTVEGAVRIDGNELVHWDPDQLGRHIGYIPQDVELFAGTVAENIARFTQAPSRDIIEAARIAGVHEVIQGLPDGYNTDIGEGGVRLSGGQRQRLALARAIFGMPPLIVLDEPNASLDTRGEECLAEAIRQLRKAGSSVVIITHRSNMIAQVDRVLVLSDGSAHLYGTREEVMRRLATPNVVPMQQPARPAAAAAAAPRDARVYQPRIGA